MSCPDWSRLAAHREDLKGAEPEGWAAALEHLDAGCAQCRPRALAADPTLVFRRLAAPELKPSQEASEIESMRQAVAAMRTASRIEALETGRRGSFQGWRRWAAAAVLTLATLSLGSDGARREQPAGSTVEEATGSGFESAFDGAYGMVMPASLATGAAGVETEPLVEELSNPAARVYEMRTDAVDAVLIVTGTGSAGV